MMNRTRVVFNTLSTISFSIAVLCCCQGQPSSHDRSNGRETEDSLQMDALLEAEDTLVLDELTEETPLPVSVDELFDDFIFNFDQSNRLQRGRIRFPLTVVEADGAHHSIERRDWHHANIFLHQDICTVFWNNAADMSMPRDTDIVHARLEHIFLHSKQVEVFVFDRDTISGQWYLTETQKTTFEHSPLASFLNFYQRFATDSIYQRQHLAHTLGFTTTIEESDYEVIRGTIDDEQWEQFAPELPQDLLVCVNYGQTYHNPNQIWMQLRGLSNGLQNLLRFQKSEGNWKLTEFEN
ncbi:MAG: DUF4348 domain-containing protein [Bacteroidales bacterium]|nr:DUF4348 domain-containing protein [Bacteroidales bacterium]